MGARKTALNAVYKMPAGISRRVIFTYFNRRLPHFSHPATFSDKVNWRILNDRRSLLEWTCDKLAMKEHAHSAAVRVPRTIWSGTDLRELAGTDLPDHWVLKPNHRSGLVHFGHGKPDTPGLLAITAGWMRPDEARDGGQWAYSRARPLFLAEEVIGTPGSPPPDYKFFVFDGEPAIVQVDTGRHDRHIRRLYRPDWTPLSVRYGPFPLSPATAPPAGLDRMLAAARDLASGFDCIRIDLYDIDGEVFLGEFTPYPAGGFDRFIPASFDSELGANWKLPGI